MISLKNNYDLMIPVGIIIVVSVIRNFNFIGSMLNNIHPNLLSIIELGGSAISLILITLHVYKLTTSFESYYPKE